MQIVKQLKGEYSFCRNIYTPQRYDKNDKTDKPPKFRKPFKMKFYQKRSKSRKPYLNKDHHVRKFDKNREYRNKLSCFTCGSTNHWVRDYTKRKNYHNKEAVLIECVNDLLHVDEYVSDTKNIYSIINYLDTNEIEELNRENEDNDFIDNILESSKKYKDKQIDDIDKLDQIEAMLSHLG